MAISEPPDGLKEHGMAYWTDVTNKFDLDPHELATLAQACKVKDYIAELDDMVKRDGITLDDLKRGTIAHPALVEGRQQRILFTRLVVSMRLPDEENGKRPQRRPLRGPYRMGIDELGA